MIDLNLIFDVSLGRILRWCWYCEFCWNSHARGI